MADESPTRNTLGPEGRTGPAVSGDVPDQVRRRYYTDDRGGPGLGFYIDATIARAAFRDQGNRLTADQADPNVIRDMAAIARHRGWTIISARGSAEFRREAWLAGRTLGLEVRGYRPTERDLQELDRRSTRGARTQDALEVRRERTQARRMSAADEREVRRERGEDRRADAAASSQLRVVNAVVRARMEDPEGQRRIMDAARQRIADWLDRGARFEAEPRREAGRRERAR